MWSHPPYEECTTFSKFTKSGRFSRLILCNLQNFSKSGAILPRISVFLFNYWKVLNPEINTFFRNKRGPKIASDNASLQSTLFPHSCGSSGLKRRFRHRHYHKTDRNDHLRKKWPVTARICNYHILPKVLIVTWYYSQPIWPNLFTRGGWGNHHFWGWGGKSPLLERKQPLLT